MKKILLVLLLFFAGYGVASIFYLNYYSPGILTKGVSAQKQSVVYEESAVTAAVKNSLPSVVTVGIDEVINTAPGFELNPFNPFSPPVQVPGQKQEVKQNIGSGFIVSTDGFIITNKHVVEDTSASYKVITNDGKKYDVLNIYRDPLNDLAILKINGSGFKPLPLGDSSNIELGQLAIAIGTPLGQFQNTVTLGIISGLGRGITTGSPLQGSVERLDNVIQTDAPINPGNSGGPLLNSSGEALGVNTAIAEGGQNIGFAIPVNSIKQLISIFKNNGSSFQQSFLGVRYTMNGSSKETSVIQGAHVVEIVAGSPAEKAGIQVGDIITEFGGTKIQGVNSDSLARLVLQKKPGEAVDVTIYRNNQTFTKQVVLEATKQ